jgi:RNA polymerase sigma-70 factor, ECF subfamily
LAELWHGIPGAPPVDDAQLDALVASAIARWPSFRVEPAVFVRYVADRAAPQLATLHGNDLYLACACLQGDPAALTALDTQYLQPLEPALRHAAPPGHSEDALQLVREKLLTASGDAGRPRLADYRGRGPLARWLRVAAVRTAFNLRRSERARPTDDDDELDVLATAGRDVELDYIHARFRDDFKQAFRAAVATLSKRQRSLLRYHYAEGLTLPQVASIYRVGRATVARWLADARRQVLTETRSRIGARLQIRPSQVDTLMKLLDSRVDITLSALFQSGSR